MINQYGPLFYDFVAAMAKTFGTGFVGPRLAVLLSAIAISLLLYLLLRQRIGSSRTAFTFAALFLSLSVVRAWAHILRPDLIAIALAFLGFFVFSTYPRVWYLSVPPFVAAGFCKPSVVAAAAACFCFLLVKKEYRKAAWFAFSMAFLAGLVFLWFQYRTDGWFVFHVVNSHVAPVSFTRYLRLILLATLFHIPVIFAAILFAGNELSARAPSQPLLYLFASSLATLTMVKVGADLNHVLEWLVALCLCAGLGYQRLRERTGETATALFAVIALGVFVLATLPLGAGSLANRSECPQAYEYVKNHPGNHLLSEDLGALVLANKRAVISDPFAYGQLVRRASFSDTTFESSLTARYFDLIILSGNVQQLKDRARDPLSSDSRWPMAFVEALERNYRPVRHFACQDAAVAFEPAANR